MFDVQAPFVLLTALAVVSGSESNQTVSKYTLGPNHSFERIVTILLTRTIITIIIRISIYHVIYVQLTCLFHFAFIQILLIIVLIRHMPELFILTGGREYFGHYPDVRNVIELGCDLSPQGPT